MKKKEVFNFLTNLYYDVLIKFDDSKIPHYFSSDYIQTTDNRTSNIDEFSSHIRTLKDVIKNIQISSFHDFLYDEIESIATLRYFVEVEKKDNTKGRIEVIALFEIREGKVIRCNELTNPIDQENFKELGSINHKH